MTADDRKPLDFKAPALPMVASVACGQPNNRLSTPVTSTNEDGPAAAATIVRSAADALLSTSATKQQTMVAVLVNVLKPALLSSTNKNFNCHKETVKKLITLILSALFLPWIKYSFFSVFKMWKKLYKSFRFNSGKQRTLKNCISYQQE